MSKPSGAWNGGGPADQGAQRPTWVRWRIVALLMGLSFMSWFNRVGIPVAETPLREEFGFDPDQMGAIDTALLLAYTLCMTPGGWLIDRFGPRRALIVMGCGTALFVSLTSRAGYALLGVSWAFTSFLIIRVLMGSFSAPIYPATGKLVAHWIPFSRRAWANGLITGAAPLGMAICHVLFGHLIDAFGWRRAFVITGTATIVLTLIWTWYGRDYPSQHRAVSRGECQLIEAGINPPTASSDLADESILGPHTARRESQAATPQTKAGTTDWRVLLRNRSLVLLTLSYAAVGYFEYILNFCTKAYFKDLGMSEGDARTSSFIAVLGQVVTMPLGGLISDLFVRRFGYRRGRALMPVLGMLASAATFYATTLTRDHLWTLIWFTLANGAIAATEGAFWSTAIELGGRRGGTSGGIVNTGGNAGGALAPYVTRTVAHQFDWRPGMYLGSLICLAGVVLWYWIDPGERVEEVEEKGNALPT